MKANGKQKIMLSAMISPDFNIPVDGIRNLFTSFFTCSTTVAFTNLFKSFHFVKKLFPVVLCDKCFPLFLFISSSFLSFQIFLKTLKCSYLCYSPSLPPRSLSNSCCLLHGRTSGTAQLARPWHLLGPADGYGGRKRLQEER